MFENNTQNSGEISLKTARKHFKVLDLEAEILDVYPQQLPQFLALKPEQRKRLALISLRLLENFNLITFTDRSITDATKLRQNTLELDLKLYHFDDSPLDEFYTSKIVQATEVQSNLKILLASQKDPKSDPFQTSITDQK